MSSEGDLYEDALQEEWWAELYDEHAIQAREEFRADRLRSYYSLHPDLAGPAFRALSDANGLRDISLSATVVRATTAAELGVKNVLLRPIVYGLVHSESLAEAITQMVMAHKAVDRYRDLLVGILKEYGGVDLTQYARSGASVPLWSELRENQELRNRVVHRGEEPSALEAETSLKIAESVLGTLFPQVTTRLGFHLHDYRLCDDLHTSEQAAAILATLAKEPSRIA